MAEKITIDIDAKINAAESIKDLKELKKLLKETAAGSEDFKKLTAGIDDLEDSIKGAGGAAKDLIDNLEDAGGPLGVVAGGINKVKVAFSSFNGALKASIIGIIVTSIGLLVTAFAKTEGSLKKLEPVMIGIEKIFGGLVNALQPFLDIILDLAMKALPMVTDAIAVWFGGIVSAFTFIKEAAGGISDILVGVFTGDTDKITAGYDQLTGTWDKTTKAYEEFQKNFKAGTEKQTATQKKNAEDQAAIDAKRLAEKIKHLEAQDKLDASVIAQEKANELALQTTEQGKLDTEKKFYELSYNARVKDLLDKQKLYKKGTDEYIAINTELNQADAERTAAMTAFGEKQKEVTKTAQKALYDTAIQGIELKKAQGLVTEESYQKGLYDLAVKYGQDVEGALIKYEAFKTEVKKKSAEDARVLRVSELQDEIDKLTQLNDLAEYDYQQDQERLLQIRTDLGLQRATELENLALTEKEKNEIRKKYAKEEQSIDAQLTASKKAEMQARTDIQLQYADTVQRLGSLIGQVAGDNKDLAIAGIVIEQGAALAKVIISTMSANAAATAAAAPFVANPFTAIPASINLARVITMNNISGVLSAAGIIAGAAKGISAINSAKTPAGSGGGGGGSAASAPQISFQGATPMQAPQGTMTSGVNASSQIAQSLAQTTGKPIQAYVVSTQLNSQSALDRRTNRASTFSGG